MVRPIIKFYFLTTTSSILVTDFCLWAPSNPNSLIADTEGEEVAWCTKPGRGTRVIPSGALTGVQFMKTPDYLQAVGFIDQTKINLQQDDYGGELDPHGADLVRNCLLFCIDSLTSCRWSIAR